MTLLSADSLSKQYGSKTVLTNVSFSLGKGEFVSIVGPSGEGKSTLARILCGTVRPDSGSATFGGRPLFLPGGSYDQAHRRDIQLIPQQPFASLDPRQSIGNAIAEPLLFHRLAESKAEAKAQVNRLLEKVALSPALYDRRPGELSGGQAQRVLIARSLTVTPRLLIADEATSMLDVSSQAQIVRIFQELVARDGLSVLLISHDSALVEAVSDRVYQISHGEMTELKKPTTEDSP